MKLMFRAYMRCHPIEPLLLDLANALAEHARFLEDRALSKTANKLADLVNELTQAREQDNHGIGL